jgi:hypothetical protein
VTYAEAPNWADVMQAWGTAAGAVMSALAVLAAVLLLRHEMRVRREEQADFDAAQARLVVAELWEVGRDGRDHDLITHVAWHVTNYSAGPILSLSVRVEQDGKALMPDGEVGASNDREAQRAVLADDRTGGNFKIENPMPYPWKSVEQGSPRVPDVFTIVMSFTDVNGLRWSRRGMTPPVRIIETSLPHRSSAQILFAVALVLGATGLAIALVALAVASH